MTMLLLFQPSSGAIPVLTGDTANLQAVEAPVDLQIVRVFDTAYVSLGELVAAGLTVVLARADFTNLHLADSSSINITGIIAKDTTDSASLHLSEASNVAVSLPRTDTASLTLSELSALLVNIFGLSKTDTASLTLAEISALNVFTTVVPFNTGDQVNLSLGEASSITKNAPPSAPTQLILSTSASRIVMSTS